MLASRWGKTWSSKGHPKERNQARRGALPAYAGDTSSSLDPIEYAPGAPPLATYDTTFVVVVGRQAIYSVRFVGWSIPFLKLEFPQDAEFFDGPGNRLKFGDTVRVTLSIDSAYAALSFGPHGSLFMGHQPATLYLNYFFLDLGGEAPTASSVWYQPAAGGAWTAQASVFDIVHWWLVTPIYHFSNYAIAYRH